MTLTTSIATYANVYTSKIFYSKSLQELSPFRSSSIHADNMAAINTRVVIGIGCMLMLTVCFIRAQGEETEDEDDQYAEYMDLMTRCKFPKLSLAFFTESSGKPFHEVCKDSPSVSSETALSLLCRNMLRLTMVICNQTQVSEVQKGDIDNEMTLELSMYNKEEVPFCTRLEGKKNASKFFRSFLPQSIKCEVSCKKGTAEKLCEFIYVSIIAYGK